MFYFLMLLTTTGCMTNKKMLEKAKTQIIGQCLDEIEIKLMKNGCPNIE